MFRKVIALVLVMTMTILTVGYSITSETKVYAQNEGLQNIFEGSYKEYQDFREELLKDSILFEKFGQNMKSVNKIRIDNNRLVYEFIIAQDAIAHVLINETSYGIHMDIDENGIKNQIVLTDDNKLFLDGNEVLVEKNILQGVATADEVFGRDSESWDTTSNPCPNKTWVYQYTSSNSDIRLGKAFKLISGYAVSVVLAVTCPAMIGILYGTGTTLDALGDLYDPDSSYISSKIKIYYPSGGQNIGYNTLVTKKVGTFYTQAGFAGQSTSQTWYHVKQFY